MTGRGLTGRGPRTALLSPHAPRWLAALSLAAAAAMVAGGVTASALTTVPARSSQPGPDRDLVSAGLGRSVPVRIVIPRLRVDALVVPLKLQRGGLGLPPDARNAGWYERGTSPGELGSAVIVGSSGPAARARPVFTGLDQLAAGDTVQVVRADGVTASFAVERVLAPATCPPGRRACRGRCGPDAEGAARGDSGTGTGDDSGTGDDGGDDSAGNGTGDDSGENGTGDGCAERDALHEPVKRAQLRLVSAPGTDPPVDHHVVVFASLRP